MFLGPLSQAVTGPPQILSPTTSPSYQSPRTNSFAMAQTLFLEEGDHLSGEFSVSSDRFHGNDATRHSLELLVFVWHPNPPIWIPDFPTTNQQSAWDGFVALVPSCADLVVTNNTWGCIRESPVTEIFGSLVNVETKFLLLTLILIRCLHDAPVWSGCHRGLNAASCRYPPTLEMRNWELECLCVT